jgi:hypothetical protein
VLFIVLFHDVYWCSFETNISLQNRRLFVLNKASSSISKTVKMSVKSKYGLYFTFTIQQSPEVLIHALFMEGRKRWKIRNGLVPTKSEI